MNLRNKKGSFAVFAVMSFSTMLILIFAVIRVSGELAVESASKHFGRLWGKSILAEFDIKLKERYGLTAFYGSEYEVAEKLDFYAGYTFDEKPYVEYGGAECNLSEYCLTDEGIFVRQLEEITVSGIKPDISDGIFKHADDRIDYKEGRRITSGWILGGLPSKNQKGGIGVFSIIEKIRSENGFSEMISQTAENIYIFNFFRHKLTDSDLGKTFFDNEIEYLVSGTPDDTKSERITGNYITAIRNGLNLVYLYSCAEKRDLALAAAQAIAPGPSAYALQAVILEAWAYLEAVNDLKILYDGKAVPALKKDCNWALSFDNIFGDIIDESGEIMDYEEDDSDGRYIEPDVIEGFSYEAYLKVLTAALPQKLKVKRIMDLIQINMKYLYCDSFLLCDYYTGLNFSLEVNGRNYVFEEKY